MENLYQYSGHNAQNNRVLSTSNLFNFLLLLFFTAFSALGVQAQIGPNCSQINASIGVNDSARILVGELVTNMAAIATQGDSVDVEILGSYGQRIFYVQNVGAMYPIELYACPYIGRQLKVNVSITGGGGSCWSWLTFKQGNGPVILGRAKTVYCFDPLVKGGHIHDIPPQAVIPCRGSEDATFVADWITAYPCDADSLGLAANDTAKVILREYEAFDKEGKRGVGYDTIYVVRLPQITTENAFCTERDTVYCGEGGKLGPYMVAGRAFNYGGPDSIERFEAISFVESAYNAETGYLEFYPAEFDPKCGVSVHVDAWPIGTGECVSQYKVNVEIKQSCYGTPGLYDMVGASDVAMDFVNTFHPKHWKYERSEKTQGNILVDTTSGTPDLSVFYGSTYLPNPLLKQIAATGATQARLYSGSGAYARMCASIPQDGDMTFTISGSDGIDAGYRLNGDFYALANGTHTLSLAACDEFCFEDRGSDFTVSGFSWLETAVAAPLDSIGPGYWRCEFWVIDLDTLPPVIECDLDKKANADLVHEDTLYIPASSHDCASHSYIPPVKVVDDWSGVKYVKAIIPGIATVVLTESEVDADYYESHKQVKIPHGGVVPIYYEAYDSCHNLGYDTCWVKVKDFTPPVAICDKGVTVSLSGKKVWVNAETFDEGSWDNCEVNLLLARRVDWYESCVDLCDDYDWCCTDEHYDTLYKAHLEEDKHIDEVEAHYAKYLEWLCNDYVECAPIIYNAWQYALMKHATLKCIEHPYEVDDHYFKQLFKECYSAYRDAYGYSRAPNGVVNGILNLNEENGHDFNDISEDDYAGEKYCFDEFKQLPGVTGYGHEEIQSEIDLYEQIGGGWSDAVPFDCEDACSEVMVELLVMDYWCNWSKCWTWVKVEDKTPVTFGHEVDKELEITCAAYKAPNYELDGYYVSLESIVEGAKSGEEQYLAALDDAFGGYDKVWRDEYGNIPEATHSYYIDEYCHCETLDKQVKVYDEHLGYIWKTEYYDTCWTHYDTVYAYDGQVVVNCGQAIQCEQEVWCEFDHCGQGYIYRKWKFVPGCPVDTAGHYSSGHSLDTVTRKQVIWVGNNCELEKGMFSKPEETTVYTCGIEYDEAGNATGVLSPDSIGKPEYLFDDDCRIVGISYSDKVFKIVGGDEACYKVVRTWYFMDWCYLGGKPENAAYWWLDPEYKGHTIEWEQKIIVQDTVPPVCTFAEDLETVEAAGCSYTLSKEVAVVDVCGALAYEYELYDGDQDLIGEGYGELDGMETSFTIEEEGLTTGSYTLKVRVRDECQNESYCIDEFSVITGKKPAAICITSLTAELTPMDLDQNGEVDTAMVTVWANEFDRSSSPACNSEDSIYFRIELLDGIGDTTYLDDADSLVLTCDNLGTQQVRLWVIDEKGSFDYCDVLIVVQNNMGGCPDVSDTDKGIVLGSIYNENGSMIENVNVDAEGQNLAANLVTGADGAYNFEVPVGMITTITPTKNIEHGNGVSTMDLILLQKHIVGMELIESPYRKVAADINRDGFINALDLLEMRRLILGEIDRFESNTSWRFILKEFEFATEQPQAEDFPERLVINMNEPQMQQDFIGMKIGDMDLDSDPAKRAARNTDELIVHAEDRTVQAGEKILVPFRINATEAYHGFQFTLRFDQSKLKVLDVLGNEALNLNERNFGRRNVDRGRLTTSWSTEAPVYFTDEVVFSIVVEVQKTASLSEIMTLNSDITTAVAYPAGELSKSVALYFVDDNAEPILKLHQNEPNPFNESTLIRFNLPRSTSAIVTFYDVTGKQLKEIKGDYAKGVNTIRVRAEDLGTTGMVYYELKVEGETMTKKMIIQ